MELKKSGKEYRQVRAVSNLASKHGVKALFYITPINLDFMARKGAFDQRAFEASKELIIEATRAAGAYCLDLSGLLGDEYFTDVTAHYNLEGRQKMCDALAPVVTDILRAGNMGTGLLRHSPEGGNPLICQVHETKSQKNPTADKH